MGLWLEIGSLEYKFEISEICQLDNEENLEF